MKRVLDSRVSKWLRQIEENIQTRKLLRRRESVLVAVSGGVDSMALLYLLHELSKTHGWKLTVAHFNHQLRGRSSDADERLVQKTSAALGLKSAVDRRDVKKFAQENRLSLEMAARQLRHEFLARTANQLRIKTIALAHHADDQAELFFLRLLRGAGTEGLSGMNWKSRSPADLSLRLVRPFLDQGKNSLRDYANAKKINFREDASNAALDFQRNRIRHEVFPLLKTMQPGLNETILRTMELSSSESSFVLGAALEWLRNPKLTPFDQLHIAVHRVCLLLLVRTVGFPANFDLVEQLRARTNLAVSVDSEHSVYRDAAGLVYARTQNITSFNGAELRIDLTQQNEIEFSQRKISWAVQKIKRVLFQQKPNCEFFDADKVGAKIILRHWKRGDRFQPIGGKSPKKLQDLFMDMKIPRIERHQRIVAATERGEIFWVEGVRISERFKLDKASKCRVKWSWHRI